VTDLSLTIARAMTRRADISFVADGHGMKDARAIIAFPAFLSSVSARRALRVRSLPANLITLLQFEQRREKGKRKKKVSAAARTDWRRFTHVCCTRACTHTHTHARTHARTRGRGYTPAGPCLYGTFSGSQAAVGTINDNPSLSLSLSLFLSLARSLAASSSGST